MILGLGIGVLVWAAFALDLVGFMARDELIWRGLMFGASCLYLFYYFFVTETPLWDAFLTNMTLGIVNLWMIGIVLFERSTFSMSAETAALYSKFHLLSPGQFRRLMKSSEEIHGSDANEIIQEGAQQDALFFLIEGEATVEKGDKLSSLGAGNFLGEIAYITGTKATASIKLDQQARCLRWSKESLSALTRKAPAIGTALAAHLNSDMAQKLAKSAPAA